MKEYQGKIVTDEGEVAHILPLRRMGHAFAVGNLFFLGAKKNDSLINKCVRWKKRVRRGLKYGNKNSKRERREIRNCKTRVVQIKNDGFSTKGVFARKNLAFNEIATTYGSLLYKKIISQSHLSYFARIMLSVMEKE